jgi:NET1-associated nuclear protein 1 (U3 small nucleolar RNA-associated protein 17)
VVCGDDIGSTVSVHEEEGTTVKGLKSFAPQQKRTLFQDIFGKSIFDEPLPTGSEVPHQLSSGTAKGLISSVFDGPTHLMPPIENLYDGLMKRYLKRRPEDVKSSVPEQKDQDDDVEMEDASAENAITSSQATITMKEPKLDMTALVELFKTHSLQPTRSSAPRREGANGVSKVLSARTNGSASHSPSPAPRTSASIPAITKPVVPLSTTKIPKLRPSPVVSDAISPSPTLVNGKKRKKATD